MMLCITLFILLKRKFLCENYFLIFSNCGAINHHSIVWIMLMSGHHLVTGPTYFFINLVQTFKRLKGFHHVTSNSFRKHRQSYFSSFCCALIVHDIPNILFCTAREPNSNIIYAKAKKLKHITFIGLENDSAERFSKSRKYSSTKG